MNTRYLILTALTIAFITGYQHGYAQGSHDTGYIFDLVPADKVLFEDDFESDAIGSFPAKWRQLCSECQCEMAMDNERQVFSFILGKDVFADAINTVKPQYGVYVTFEFDFRLLDTANANVQIQFRSADSMDTLGFMIDRYWLHTGWINKSSRLLSFMCEHCCMTPNHKHGFHYFDPTIWHHFGISFTKNETRNYMDHYSVGGCGNAFTMKNARGEQNTRFMPGSFMLAGTASFEIKNVRFAESDHVPAPHPVNFNGILTGRNFITHAIHFEVNKSVIKEESIDYIDQLAAWLQQNPGVKLEIDGHTDNDGNAESNKKLSQDRADAVKNKLVSLSIAADRLTTRGYGASKPIKPNATAEGKAENRRVEFIKR